MNNTYKDKKEEFYQRLRSTKREGIEEILTLLEGLGFFKAPASTRFHLNYEGGLVEHSLNVCDVALEIREVMIKMDESLMDRLPVDSVIIASLLHDTCKADIYKPTSVGISKMAKMIGQASKVPPYIVDYGSHPFGHGEKSVILLLQNGLKLTNDEMLAIRWHMSAWDLPFQSHDILGNINKAKNICPLVTLIQSADGLASHILENKHT